MVNEQQFGDQLLCDVGAEIHDDGFDRLVQRQFMWPASSVIPNDALPDTLNKFVELFGRESRSRLTWQWSLRTAKTIGVAFKFSRWDHCSMINDTREC